jgi:tetratricopeptide (TPR) repeat protein
MKALEKDRTRRYSAASELAADIGRYLKNEPVLAGPPSGVYRLHKFVRRHRAGVAFAAILFVLLTSFATTMTIQRNQVARARDRAKQEAQTNQRVSEFLSGLFMQSDPSESRGHEMTAREILDRGATRIREELKDAPALQARLMSIMGDVYSTHGRSDRAHDLLDHALQIQQELNDDDLALALTMERLAGLYSEYGNRDRALRYYKKVVEIRLEQLGAEDPAVAQAMNSLANVHRLSGNREDALELYEKAANIWSSLDPNNPQLAATLSNRAIMLQFSGDHAAARPLLERALAIRQRAFGPDHPDISWSLQTLGTLLEAAGDYAGARRYLLQALEMNERLFEPDNRKIGLSLVLLATLCARQGELPEAEAFHARAASLYEETDSYESAAVLYLEASYALAIGDPPAALELLRKALVEQDFLGPEALKQDPNFVPLHGDPGFDAIVAAISGASASSQLPGDQSRE